MASAKSVGGNFFRLPCGGKCLDESLFVSRVQSKFYFSSFKSHVVYGNVKLSPWRSLIGGMSNVILLSRRICRVTWKVIVANVNICDRAGI